MELDEQPNKDCLSTSVEKVPSFVKANDAAERGRKWLPTHFARSI